jgi:hypothetical protein
LFKQIRSKSTTAGLFASFLVSTLALLVRFCSGIPYRANPSIRASQTGQAVVRTTSLAITQNREGALPAARFRVDQPVTDQRLVYGRNETKDPRTPTQLVHDGAGTPTGMSPPYHQDHRLHLRGELMRAAVKLRTAVGRSTHTAIGVTDQPMVNRSPVHPTESHIGDRGTRVRTSLTARYRCSTTDRSPSILRSSSAPVSPSQDLNQTIRRGASETQEPKPGRKVRHTTREPK